MAGRHKKKLPKEPHKPQVANVVLQVSSKSGAPVTARDKFRLRKAMQQFARAALDHRPPEAPLDSGDGP
jgi:hypothetical protein